MRLPSLRRCSWALLGVLAAWTTAATCGGAEERWAFTPPDDPFDAHAAFDLRSLNEPIAGASGFVHSDGQGHFLLGDGKPARFWAMNIGTGANKDADLAHEARFLAKHGVNLVRIFLNLEPDLKANPAAEVTDVRQQQIQRCWKVVAAMKKEGIYSLISPYWPTQHLGSAWQEGGHKAAWGVLFSDATLQRGYKAWMKALLTPPNPETGVPLAQEPALAVIQIVNEDSLLFWTFQAFLSEGGAPVQQLRKAFGDWAIATYGSFDAALAAWGGKTLPGDNAAAGELGFYQTYVAMHNPGGKAGERIAAQLQFLATHQRDFYRDMAHYLRSECGCKQLINASNWRPADPETQFDLERWSYGDTDVMAVNRYCNAPYLGKDTGWAIDPGNRFEPMTCTTRPDQLPFAVKQPVGKPMVITESSWVMPNPYQAEGPMLVAAYSSLTGLQGYCWFVSGDRDWNAAIWPWGKMYLWNGAVPMELGLFPAAAWMYRQGYLDEGKPAVHEERALTDMWHGRPPLISEEAGYDQNRDKELPKDSAVKSTIDPLAFLVGRVEVVYGGNPAHSTQVDLASYLDRQAKTVRSVTGEERLNWQEGLFVLASPKAVGAAGFLGKAGAVPCGDAVITCTNPYAAVTLVSLDGLPIRQSKRLLLQVGTTERPTEWKDHAQEIDLGNHRRAPGMVIDSIGHNPWSIECAHGSIAIANPALATAVSLNANAMPTTPLAVRHEEGRCVVPLPERALYALITAP